MKPWFPALVLSLVLLLHTRVVTAGTSTPDATIQAVAEWLHQLAAWQATRNGLSVEPLSLQHHE